MIDILLIELEFSLQRAKILSATRVKNSSASDFEKIKNISASATKI